jgi:hypothetical protein
MLPPLAYAACIETIRYFKTTSGHGGNLQIHFADEEGDPYAVEMAARLDGYVVGNDSDFVVLNAEGYRGYIPLDEMIWSALPNETDSAATDNWEDGDGFQTVINSKSRKKAATQQMLGRPSSCGIIPPEGASDNIQLSVKIYSPTHLASHLEIPLSLLPLLAALVGNDFTGARYDSSSATTSHLTNLQWLFFERQLTLTGRILRVATTLRSILHAALTPSGKKKSREKVSSVMDLIDRAVTALIIRNVEFLASGEKERVVERVVEATLQYAIPKWEGDMGQLWSSNICALHDPVSCPLVLLRLSPQPDRNLVLESSQSATSSENGPEYLNVHSGSELDQLRVLYISAYRDGYIDPHTLDPLHSGTFWYRQFLENPDLESVSKTFARPIQLWMYSILDNAFGLPQRTAPPSGNSEAKELSDDVDDSELIDVIEETDSEDDDPLAPLRGALQQLNETKAAIGTDLNGENSLLHSLGHSGIQAPLKVVKEYLRRGTRVAAEDVEVPPLAELLLESSNVGWNDKLLSLPLVLQPPEQRFAVLLRAAGTPVDHLPLILQDLHHLPAEQRIPLLTLRAVLMRLCTRAQQNGGHKEREKEKWTKPEARAFLASFTWLSPAPSNNHEIEQDVPIMDRSVQLTAQALATMDAIERLSQCLLLTSFNETNGKMTFPTPASLFSGKAFHAYLLNPQSIPQGAVSAVLWDAACRGMGDAFNEPHNRRRKKDKDSEAGTNRVAPKVHVRHSQKKVTPAVGGKFGLLASLSVE